ncbi:DNA methyltransferase [Arthrobacter sp. 2RAF22]|uniref:DNA methyltransferase n=1 Tax=Arthrobacter sp. 2RAF22 TaxID=3232996 RepID=UPI003F8EC2E2
MPSFDSIVVGEDWISEHYFTTDSTKESFQSEVLKLRKQWDEQAKEGHESVLKRFLSERGTFQVELAELVEEPNKASAVYHKVREALGFKGTKAELTVERAGTTVRVPNVWTSHNRDLLFLESRPVESLEDLLDSAKATMLAPALIDDKTADLSAPKLVSELYRTDEPPKFIVVFGGRWLLLTERDRWAEGRYLAADLLLACERNDTKRGGEIDRVLAIFGLESLLPDASESIWWNQILENSVKHTIGVSKDLREGIRLSIEIIANDVLRRREAQGLPLDAVDGQSLARQSLRYLYRILFLLYAEASPEMGVLPVGAGEYTEGYGLDRLRELTLTPLNSPQAVSGTHIYQSLHTLFRLVDQGHHPSDEPVDAAAVIETTGAEGLHFDSLKADLFDPTAMQDIDGVGLGNSELQKVLQHLLLSKEARGKDRGFISYAELGVNQLGAVYEGLMSYTGFIAETDLYEVAKDGDSSKGSWVVPVERSESIERKHFVMTANELTGEPEPVLHEKGTFVFRLAGRERQQSASYYTPEVLTRFVVSQALEELLGKKLDETPADDILKLTVCEPALGSGAFAIEAVRQLADAYLKLKQAELGQTIPAEDYPVELQKVKAQIALHQVYGVDLNSTAVELAEVSLWLDTMVSGLQAPWFGLHLRRGNSLIGARRATYSRASVNDKSWLMTVPADAPLSGLAEAIASESDDPNVVGRIHHFLLPAAGWGAASEAKEVKDLAGEAQKELKAWRNRIKAKPSKTQVDRLVNLGRRVETLWQFALRRLEVAESEARRTVDYFGKRAAAESDGNPVSRAEIEAKLGDPNGAIQRLRRVMDAWNALWFWPISAAVSHGIKPPTLDEWIAGLESILGLQAKDSKMVGQQSLLAGASWNELNQAEDLELRFAGALEILEAIETIPWLKVCQEIAADQGFFHWELDFGTVFARGGFDLQIGNPPWVRPRWEEDAVMAEADPWWQLSSGSSETEKQRHREGAFSDKSFQALFVELRTALAGQTAHLSDPTLRPFLKGLQPELYRAFMEQVWRNMGPASVVGLVHPDSHFSEDKAASLRQQAYERLRRHWKFTNELKLFEIGHARPYAVHIYGTARSAVGFLHAASLLHPDTVVRSLVHDGNGPQPGIKDDSGNWDTRPHLGRIVLVTDAVLKQWSALMSENGAPVRQAKMLYPANLESSAVLAKLAGAARFGELVFEWTRGWEEDQDRKLGRFIPKIGKPIHLEDAIYQGPHFTVSNPFFQEVCESGVKQGQYVSIDLERMPVRFSPSTNYQIAGTKDRLAYTTWQIKSHSPNRTFNPNFNQHVPSHSFDFYRLAWRRMADPATVRSLHACLLPPGPMHVGTILSLTVENPADIFLAAGFWASLPVDFMVKAAGILELKVGTVSRFPHIRGHSLEQNLLVRSVLLNALTEDYAPIWKELYVSAWKLDSSPCAPPATAGRFEYSNLSPNWTQETPLRSALVRRFALIEIDAIVAVMLGISADELCTIYRTQFPVLQGYERNDLYDLNGRKVPNDIGKLYRQRDGILSEEERTATNAAGNTYTYDFPFLSFDREVDMRQAHAHFNKLTEGMN